MMKVKKHPWWLLVILIGLLLPATLLQTSSLDPPGELLGRSSVSLSPSKESHSDAKQNKSVRPRSEKRPADLISSSFKQDLPEKGEGPVPIELSPPAIAEPSRSSEASVREISPSFDKGVQTEAVSPHETDLQSMHPMMPWDAPPFTPVSFISAGGGGAGGAARPVNNGPHPADGPKPPETGSKNPGPAPVASEGNPKQPDPAPEVPQENPPSDNRPLPGDPLPDAPNDPHGNAPPSPEVLPPIVVADTEGPSLPTEPEPKETASVPEPSTLLLIGSGLSGLAFLKRKKK